jgi:acetyl esterase/lipase
LVLIAHDVCVDRRTQLTKIAGPAPFDNYNQPVLAPADWFSGIDKLVKGILVWGGEQEVLIDSIDAIAKTLKSVSSNVEYVRSQGGAHVGWLSHKLLMISGKEESTQAIESWMAARL